VYLSGPIVRPAEESAQGQIPLLDGTLNIPLDKRASFATRVVPSNVLSLSAMECLLDEVLIQPQDKEKPALYRSGLSRVC
ncbi:MAG: hypothetical protein PVI52_04915, partial [Chromatiales bacterium]